MVGQEERNVNFNSKEMPNCSDDIINKEKSLKNIGRERTMKIKQRKRSFNNSNNKIAN